MHATRRDESQTDYLAVSSRATSTPTIAITTNSSTSVTPRVVMERGQFTALAESIAAAGAPQDAFLAQSRPLD